jgi:hypothetical protein
MQGNKQTIFIHIPGTLAANIVPKWKAEQDATLLHVSAVASNDSSATLKIGTSADDDAFLAEAAIGDSGTPVEKRRADFVGGELPRIARGELVVLTLDYDGASGTAAQNVTLALTFAEG